MIEFFCCKFLAAFTNLQELDHLPEPNGCKDLH